jgi:hypothetical protein
LNLKLLLKRGALLAVANWPTIAIQFMASATFQALVAVPIIGGALVATALIGTDLGNLLTGGLSDILATLSGVLAGTPSALAAFGVSLGLALAGGAMLTFLVKGGTVSVLVASHDATRPVEREPLPFDLVDLASRFTLERFLDGCARCAGRYAAFGAGLLLADAASGAVAFAVVVSAFRQRESFTIGWTAVTALVTAALVAWMTLLNVVYLLLQIAIAADDLAPAEAVRAVVRFVRAERGAVAAVLVVELALVAAATAVSALAWSGVGLVAFIPLVGLSVIPLQLVALVVRGLVFQLISLAAVGAYIALYRRQPRTGPRGAAGS